MTIANRQSNLYRIFDRYTGHIKEYTTSQEQAERILQFLEYDRSQPVTNIGRYSIATPNENIIKLEDVPMPAYVTAVI